MPIKKEIYLKFFIGIIVAVITIKEKCIEQFSKAS